MPRRYYPPRGEVYKKYVPRESELNVERAPYRRDEGVVYKSAPMSGGVCAAPGTKTYTGTLVKGIGTMHKSNAIPIIDEEQMRDIATMRRN
jgi:hypothetical protein